MNKKIPTPLAILIIVLVIAVIAGISLWLCPKEKIGNVACTQEAKLCPDGSYVSRTGPNCEFAECSEIKDENKGIVAIKEIEIVLPKYKEWPCQPGEFYYHVIDKSTKIVFICREADGGSFPNGDVILKKNGNNFILLNNTELFGPGGEAFSVWTTNNPDVFLVRFGSGDMGWWLIDDYYLDLTKNKIVFAIHKNQEGNLKIEKDGFSAINLDLMVIDNCGTNGERAGKKAQIVDLTLNGEVTNILEEPIEMDCIDTETFGPIYNPDFYLEERKIENNFSQLSFNLVGFNWEDETRREVWKKEFYIPLTDLNNIKIYRENL